MGSTKSPPRKSHRRSTTGSRVTRNPRRTSPTADQKAAIARMIAQNSTMGQIARDTGVSKYHIIMEMASKGLTFAHRHQRRAWKVTEAHKLNIGKLFDQGSTLHQIQQAVGLNVSTVAKVLLLLGKTRRPRRRGGAKKVRLSCIKQSPDSGSRQSPEIPEPTVPISSETRPARQCGPRDQLSTEVPQSYSSRRPSEIAESVATEELPAWKATVESSVVRCHESVYRCEACQFHADAQDPFVSHLLCDQHTTMSKRNVYLVCAGCRFRTRHPMKMIHHAIGQRF